MIWNEDSPPPSAAERKALARAQLAELQAAGRALEPIGPLKKRIKIADSFWGRHWCLHLSSFSGYDCSLPQGRSHLRNEAVLHLAIQTGEIHALVYDEPLYELTIGIDPIAAERWAELRAECPDSTDARQALLQGTLPDEVRSQLTDPERGLFPPWDAIHFNCNCPDYSDLCPHVAAALYAVAVRLDESPELLFTLRAAQL